ncbi:MAG: beta-lactamase family protein [candidate division KSB1 bacterium]|nr:beta-lactamase family protein [candidate division KSB1 bacterium]MDZ7340058.1 beta-lactamase family protein [candidate division KSB1 bacterium]
MTVHRPMFLLFLLVLLCCQSRSHQVDQLFQIYNQPNAPGAAIMVIKNGKPILKKTYGLANIETATPVTSNTNFRLASVTKQFTALCILMLIEKQLLSLDQTLTDIFPDFPAYGQKITVRHLLTHTSGLIDYEDLIPDSATVQVLDRDVLRMMKAQDSTYFEPGTQYRYSNSGYAVLAMIVEKVSGQSFATFLKSRIFDPLGMSGTVAFENGVSEVTHRAYGYASENGAFVFRDQSLTSAVLGDGGIYSSIEDLFKWDQALYTHRLVDTTTLALAFTPAVLSDGTPLDYGFGWRIDSYRGHRRLHHTGQTCGFTTIIQRYPEIHFSIIILTNRHEPMLTDLANAVADLYISQQ